MLNSNDLSSGIQTILVQDFQMILVQELKCPYCQQRLSFL